MPRKLLSKPKGDERMNPWLSGRAPAARALGKSNLLRRATSSWGFRQRPKVPLLMIFCWLLVTAAAGCQPPSLPVAPAETPTVPVSHPIKREVTDFVDFTGRTDAVYSVNIIARVTGYLVQMPFREGSEVKKKDLLFEIDPRPYQAQFDQAKSQVTLFQAQFELAKKTLARYVALSKSTPGAVSQQALDQYEAAVTEAEARVNAQQKTLEVYRLNKEFTRVVSPIDGQVSRYYLSLGNLVNQDQTLLTTVVSLDPMYAYFDMDERTLLQIRQALSEGKIVPYGGTGEIPVLMGLQNEEGFPHKGSINFVNNQVNSTTGSITMRGVFPNPQLSVPPTSVASSGSNGSPNGQASSASPSANKRTSPRLLSPGMFVKIRLPIGQPHEALLVIDRAIQSDQGLKYVYVLDAENKAQYHRVTTGALQEDGMRVVTGVDPSAWIVVGGLQQVRARMEIKPEQVPMPSLGRPSNGDAQPGTQSKGDQPKE
jgi:membrane fusion protein, multidrug efflux system